MSAPAPSRRPRLILGPGLVVAVLLAVGLLLLQHRAQGPRTLQLTRPVQPIQPPVLREPALLLQYADKLQLTPDQRRQIKALAEQYEREAAPLRKEADRATAKLRAYMDQQAQAKATDLTALRQQAARLGEPSARLGQLRWRYWEMAAALLSREQSVQLQRLVPPLQRS
jgi:hypothetical protein